MQSYRGWLAIPPKKEVEECVREWLQRSQERISKPKRKEVRYVFSCSQQWNYTAMREGPSLWERVNLYSSDHMTFYHCFSRLIALGFLFSTELFSPEPLVVVAYCWVWKWLTWLNRLISSSVYLCFYNNIVIHRYSILSI